MVVDHSTGLAADMGITDEMMAHPDPRVPLIDSENIPEELQAELAPAFEWSKQMWGTVPRFLRMLGHAPVAVEAWLLMDQKIRIDYLEKDPDYVKIEELVIVKTALLTECNN
ncbi:MAG: hypothetical protein HQ494_03165 [Rhodospirillales bacterium]|nr:hypothetical protein [Rhodospirillales bacterium]